MTELNPTARLFPFTVADSPALKIVAAAPGVIRITKEEWFTPAFDLTAGRFRKRLPKAYARIITYTQDILPLDLYRFGGAGGLFRRLSIHRRLKAWTLSADFRGVNAA